MTTTLVCSQCRTRYDGLEPVTRCRTCRGLLEIALDSVPGTLAADWRSRPGPAGSGSGVWRYRELVLPEATNQDIVSFPEGNTPLLTRGAVADWAGISKLELKHEGMNPTGSFKDRGMTVAATQAKRLNVRGVACASTGNTSASLAAYAAQAGLLGVVLVPAGKIAIGKLAQTVAYGARILAVDGDFDACLRLVDEASSRLGLYLLNSINPFRLAGQQTIVFELLEQRGWKAPHWIVLPGGNLGNTAAFGQALVRASEYGLIDRIPRLAVIQAAGAAPFAKSFAEGFAKRYALKAETVATAIRIGDPASHDRAVAAVRSSNGVVTTVSDDEILAAKAIVDGAGVGCEPASAASVAGARRLAEQGVIGRDDEVVAILTGHLLKDPEVLLSGAQGSRLTQVEATVEGVERAIR